jgi:iron(III) transport system permease protein
MSILNQRRVWILLVIAALLILGFLPLEQLSSAASRRQLWLSLVLAGGSAVIAITIALPLAVVLTRIEIIGRRAAWFVLTLLLFAPLYVQLAGWDAVGGWLGWYGRNAPQAFLSGIAAATWVHGVAAVPWATMIIAAGLAQVPRREEELALLEASPLTIFTHVLLPRIAPWIVVAACLAMVTAWQEMTVTNVYLVPTVTEGIYNQIAINSQLGAAGDAVNAAVYLLPGLIVIAGLFVLGTFTAQYLLTADFPATSREPMFWPYSKHTLASLAVWSLLIFLAGVPLFVLIRQAGLQLRLEGNEVTRQWNLPHFAGALLRTARMMRQDLVWTLLTAGTAASLSIVVATLAAWWARTGGWLIAIAIVAAILLATPGPLVGVSIISLLNRPEIPGFTYLYDRTIAAPALAQAVRALPITLLIAWHALARFDRPQQEAAALDGCGSWTILGKIVLPQRWRAMIVAWGFAFALSIGDVSCSLLVIPPGMDTVARRLFGMVHSGVDDQVAAACLLLMGFLAGVAVFVHSSKGLGKAD